MILSDIHIDFHSTCIRCLLEKYDIDSIGKIQAFIRGYLKRKQLQSRKDNMTKDILIDLIQLYKKNYLAIERINQRLSKKKIRHQNYLSEISENIVKFAVFRKYKIMGNWDTTSGDLYVLSKRIEVKGFSSTGPCSFGPEEEWDFIYFVDCTDHLNANYKVYEIKLSNQDEKWRNLIVSGREFNMENIGLLPSNEELEKMKSFQIRELCKYRGISYTGSKKQLIYFLQNKEPGSKFGKIKRMGELCDTGKGGVRPHICFAKIYRQLGDEHVKMIWNGNILEL